MTDAWRKHFPDDAGGISKEEETPEQKEQREEAERKQERAEEKRAFLVFLEERHCGEDLMEKIKDIFEKEAQLGHDLLSRNRPALEHQTNMEQLGVLVDFVLADQEAREHFKPTAHLREGLALACMLLEKGNPPAWKRLLDALDPEHPFFSPVWADCELEKLYQMINDADYKQHIIRGIEKQTSAVFGLTPDHYPHFSREGVIFLSEHHPNGYRIYADAKGNVLFKTQGRSLSSFHHGVGTLQNNKDLTFQLIDAHGTPLSEELFHRVNYATPDAVFVIDAQKRERMIARDENGRLLPGIYAPYWNNADFENSPFAKTAIVARKPGNRPDLFLFKKSTGEEIAGPYLSLKFTHTPLHGRRKKNKGWEVYFGNKKLNQGWEEIFLNQRETFFSAWDGKYWHMHNEDGEEIGKTEQLASPIDNNQRNFFYIHQGKKSDCRFIDSKTGQQIGGVYGSRNQPSSLRKQRIMPMTCLEDPRYLILLDIKTGEEKERIAHTRRHICGNILYFTRFKSGEAVRMNMKTGKETLGITNPEYLFFNHYASVVFLFGKRHETFVIVDADGGEYVFDDLETYAESKASTNTKVALGWSKEKQQGRLFFKNGDISAWLNREDLNKQELIREL